MEDVTRFFNSLRLGEYVPRLEFHDYDNMGIIFEHDDEDFECLGRIIGMKPGHLFLLKRHVKALKNPRTPVIRAVPIIQFGGNTTTTDGGTGNGGPAAAAAAAAAPTPCVPTGTVRKAQHYNLPAFCKTTEEVKLESYRHSTALGSAAMRDNKSGKRKIVYRCKSVLSKRLKKQMGPDDGTQYKCDHNLTWNFSTKSGGYHLNKDKSILEHAPHCVAKQHVTRTELVHDAEFVKHSLNKLDSTGKQAAKTATGRGGRLDGSVKSRTAKRASNDVKRFHDKDYDEDWSKLGPWGAEYERLNRQPGQSRFDMMTDEENRSVMKPLGPWGLWSPGALGP